MRFYGGKDPNLHLQARAAGITSLLGSSKAFADTSTSKWEEVHCDKWTRAQLAVVQRAAALSGISYQNFIKKALMDYSVAEIQKLEAHVHV